MVEMVSWIVVDRVRKQEWRGRWKVMCFSIVDPDICICYSRESRPRESEARGPTDSNFIMASDALWCEDTQYGANYWGTWSKSECSLLRKVYRNGCGPNCNTETTRRYRSS